MIPFAEWSRERALNPPVVLAAEPRPLQASPAPEEETQDLVELLEAVVHSVAENARIGQILLMREAVAAECGAMLGQLAETVKVAAQQQTTALRGHLNGVLRPWVGQRIEERSVAAFVGEIELAFGRKLGADLVCQVPVALRETLAAELARQGLNPTLETSTDAELRVVHGETTIESTTSLWQEKLARLIT